MHDSTTFRRVARAAFPVSAVALAFLVACLDLPSTPAPADDWAQAVTVSTQLRADLTLLESPERQHISVGPVPSLLPVLRNFGTNTEINGPSLNRGGRGRTTVRHFRHGKDSVTSVALYFDQPNAPPRFIYVFENARIRAIVSPKYMRRGAGHVRTASRVTVFAPNGDPSYQADLGSDVEHAASGGTAPTNLDRTAADASHTAASFDIQEGDVPEGCFSLWISYISASAALAAAIATLKATVASCVTIVTCPLAIPVGLAVVYATDKWQIALDRLTDCFEAEKARNATPPPGGGGSSPDERSGISRTENEWNESTTSTVNAFIDNAIASNNYSCSSDGTRCVYYAS